MLKPSSALFLALCFACCLSLGACGKRAAHVDAPDDVVDDQFPHTYPDPATDPGANPSKSSWK